MSVSPASRSTSNQTALLTVNPVNRSDSNSSSSSARVDSSINKASTNSATENPRNEKDNIPKKSAEKSSTTSDSQSTDNQKSIKPEDNNIQKKNVASDRDRGFKDYMRENSEQKIAKKTLENSSISEKELNDIVVAEPIEGLSSIEEAVDRKTDEEQNSSSGFILSSLFFEPAQKDNQVASTIKNISEKIKSLSAIVRGRETHPSNVQGQTVHQSDELVATNLNKNTEKLLADDAKNLEILTTQNRLRADEAQSGTQTNELNIGNDSGKILPPLMTSSAVVKNTTVAENATVADNTKIADSILKRSELVTPASENTDGEQKWQGVNILGNHHTVQGGDSEDIDVAVSSTTKYLAGNARQLEGYSRLPESTGRDNENRFYDIRESATKLPEIAVDKMLSSSKEGASQTVEASTQQSVSEQAVKHSVSQIMQQDIQRAVMQKNPLASQLPNMLSNSQWQNGVGEKVLWMAAQNIQSAEVQLDPPELGQLHIKITIGQESASVNFVSPHASVREALDASTARLREMFQQEGLDLVDVGVSDQSKQQSFADNEGNGANGSQDNGGHELSGSDSQLPNTEMMVAHKMGLNNMVDFYV